MEGKKGRDDRIMTKKLMFIIALLALVALLAVPVSAETLNGSFDYSAVTSVATASGTSQSVVSAAYHTLSVPAIELTGGSFAYVSYDTSGWIPTYGAGLPKSGASISCNIRNTNLAGAVIGTGTFGYMRNYNLLGTEIPGYQYLLINPDYTTGITGLSGAKTLYIDWNETLLGGTITPTGAGVATIGTGGMAFLGNGVSYYTLQTGVLNKNYVFKNSYTASKPSGLGITGTVSKTVGGIVYSGKAIVYDGVTKAQITGENTLSGTNFNFNVPNNNIFIGVINSNSVQLNSTVLFTVPTATYTLTVNPDSGLTNTIFNIVSTSTIGFTGNDAFTIICNGGDTGGTCLYNGTSPVFMKKADTYWYHRSLINGAISDVRLTTSFPSSIAINFTAPGTYSIEGTFFETAGTAGTASDTVTINSIPGGSKTFKVNVQDSLSGALISGAEVQIKTPTGTWSNATTITGTRSYTTKIGEMLGYGASASGYVSSSILFTQIAGDTDRTVVLGKYIPVAVGNNTLYVYARDSRTLTGLEGALIHLGDGQTKTTPASGLATFTVLENGTYQITVSKSGFQPLTRTIQVAGSSNAISMELSPIYVTTQRTLAPGETATPAPQATIDTRTNAQKQDSAVKIIYDNAEYIVWGLVALIFIGIIKLALKGWKFW
jgi:hypothetical protein